MNKSVAGYCFMGMLLLAGCDRSAQRYAHLLEEDERLTKLFLQQGTDTAAINSLILSFHDYIRENAADTGCARLLMRMGDLFRIKNESQKSMECYNQIFLQYPSSSLHPLSLFMMGFVAENDLERVDEAGSYYELFLEKYPQHGLAKDVRFALEHLGKSPEELLDELQKKRFRYGDSL